jgi:hypothetical protein
MAQSPAQYEVYTPQAVARGLQIMPAEKRGGCGCGGGCGGGKVAIPQPLLVQPDTMTQLLLLAIAAGTLLNFLKKG